MKSKLPLICLSLLCLSALSQSAWGHGFALSLDGNHKLRVVRDADSLTTSQLNLYVRELILESTFTYSEHGGVKTGAGLTVPGDTFALEFLSPLLFSNGGAAVPESTGLTLNAESYSQVQNTPPIDTATISGTGNFAGALTVTGQSSHSIGWLFESTSVPAGAYGFSFRVTGLDDGVTPFTSSDPAVLILMTPGFAGSNPTAAADARSAIYLAAVPEPSTLVLSGVGFGLLGLAGWRRRCRAALLS